MGLGIGIGIFLGIDLALLLALLWHRGKLFPKVPEGHVFVVTSATRQAKGIFKYFRSGRGKCFPVIQKGTMVKTTLQEIHLSPLMVTLKDGSTIQGEVSTTLKVGDEEQSLERFVKLVGNYEPRALKGTLEMLTKGAITTAAHYFDEQTMADQETMNKTLHTHLSDEISFLGLEVAAFTFNTTGATKPKVKKSQNLDFSYNAFDISP